MSDNGKLGILVYNAATGDNWYLEDIMEIL